MAAITRHWSTVLNGSQIDRAAFRREADAIFQRAKRVASGEAEPVKSSREGVYRDIELTLGLVPGFLEAFPAAGLPGAWQEMKSIQMGQDGSLRQGEGADRPRGCRAGAL